jgi:branched-subunit amino acid permease
LLDTRIVTPAKLLSLEVLISGTFSIMLLAFPGISIRMLGWPQAGSTFWPRMLGAALAGVTLATITTLAGWSRDGLAAGFGLAGHITINFTMAFVMASMLMLGPDHPTRRGAIFTWGLVIALVLLALIEVAYL